MQTGTVGSCSLTKKKYTVLLLSMRENSVYCYFLVLAFLLNCRSRFMIKLVSKFVTDMTLCLRAHY